MSNSQQNDATGSWWHSNTPTAIDHHKLQPQAQLGHAARAFAYHMSMAFNERREMVAHKAALDFLNSLPWDADPIAHQHKQKAAMQAAVDAMVAKFNAGDTSWLNC